jgi:hypothetical protein
LGNGYEVFLLVSLRDKMPRQRMLHAELPFFALFSFSDLSDSAKQR